MPDVSGDDREFGRKMAYSQLGLGGGTAMAPFVAPALSEGGFLALATNASGGTFNTFASRPCRQLTIANDTGTKLEIQQDGAGATFPLLDNTYVTLFGLTNANQIGIRRVDVSNTPVTAKARWEA